MRHTKRHSCPERAIRACLHTLTPQLLVGQQRLQVAIQPRPTLLHELHAESGRQASMRLLGRTSAIAWQDLWTRQVRRLSTLSRRGRARPCATMHADNVRGGPRRPLISCRAATLTCWSV